MKKTILTYLFLCLPVVISSCVHKEESMRAAAPMIPSRPVIPVMPSHSC